MAPSTSHTRAMFLHRLDLARGLAAVRPGDWLTLADELERLADAGEAGATELVSLFLRCYWRDLETTRAFVRLGRSLAPAVTRGVYLTPRQMPGRLQGNQGRRAVGCSGIQVFRYSGIQVLGTKGSVPTP